MPSVLAIAAHPDDIEFVMAGTMLQLASRGWDLHYMNVCDGSRGSTTLDEATCAATRLEEAKQAATVLGATFYGPIARDMEVLYLPEHYRKIAAVVRQSRASVVLTHAPIDYMEDHETVCRMAVTAAFTHAMPNFATDPPEPIYEEPVTIYHAQPHGNKTPLGEAVVPHFYVDNTDVIDRKFEALGCHESQRAWLDSSQKMDSYTETMRTIGREVGRMSGKFEYAEGWRRREHWGFCGPDDDPLRTALADLIVEGRPS